MEIRDLVRDHSLDIDTSLHLRRLADEGFLSRIGDSEYKLSTKGVERCLGIVGRAGNEMGEIAYLSPDIEKRVYEEYIPKHNSYLSLIREINASYRIGQNISVALLLRKLFEVMMWEIATTVYDDMTPFLTDDHNPKNFSGIISAMKNNPDSLRGMDPRLSNTDEIRSYLSDIDNIRELGNDSAHGVDTNLSRDELAEFSDTVDSCVEISYALLKKSNE